MYIVRVGSAAVNVANPCRLVPSVRAYFLAASVSPHSLSDCVCTRTHHIIDLIFEVNVPVHVQVQLEFNNVTLL